MPFRTATRTIHAIRYTFTCGTTAICWLDEQGYAEGPWTKRSDGGPVVYTKPGERLLVDGKELEVAKVESYLEDAP